MTLSLVTNVMIPVLKIIEVPNQKQNSKTGIEMKPVPEDYITRVSYKNAMY